VSGHESYLQQGLLLVFESGVGLTTIPPDDDDELGPFLTDVPLAAAASLALISSFAIVKKAWSTFVAVFALVSRKGIPNLSANFCAVSSDTCFSFLFSFLRHLIFLASLRTHVGHEKRL